MLNAGEEALATSNGKDGFLLKGKKMDIAITEAMTTNSIVRTIAGAPTLDITVNDDQRKLLRSGIFGHAVTVGVGPFTYELVGCNKTGGTLDLTFEDQAVAALRNQTKHLKIKKGLMTHVEFARKLVGEVPWLKFKTDPSAKVVKSLEDLVRGNVSGGTSASSWDTLTGNAQARNWRCFIRGVDEVWYVPDSFLYKAASSITLKEHAGGVDTIDFELDEGKKLNTCTVNCRAKEWEIPPGLVVTVKDNGMSDGKWLVQDVTRSTLQDTTTITIVKPQAQLPEPSDSAGATTVKGSVGAAIVGADDSGGGPTPKETKTAKGPDFVAQALSHRGKPYVYGSQTSPANNDPKSFDCSLLVEWAAGRVGVSFPRTSEAQQAACTRAGTIISVEHAEKVRGALLFEGSPAYHVVISLGNGETIEARGAAYGVNEFGVAGRPFTNGALIPGLAY